MSAGAEAMEGEAPRESRTVFHMPELTRGLRVFGTSRWYPGDDHDRFFAPLMFARREARRAPDWRGRVGAFNAVKLRAELEQLMVTFAHEHYPRAAAERRALEVELQDVMQPMFRALNHLHDAGRATLREHDDETLFDHWQDWGVACRAVFEAADRCWVPVSLALAAAAPRKRHFWLPWR